MKILEQIEREMEKFRPLKYEEVAYAFVQEFPEYQQALDEHIEEFDEVLNHVFFGNMLNQYLANLLRENRETEHIGKFFRFFERMADEGDLYVRQILTTILKYMGDDKKVLETAYPYMGVQTRRLSDEVERFLGRLG